jgi:hypothetical protein
MVPPPGSHGVRGAFAGLGLCGGRRPTELNAGTASLAQADRDRLLGRARTVLAAADVMDLFADELPGLRRRPLSFASGLSSTLDSSLLRHGCIPLEETSTQE